MMKKLKLIGPIMMAATLILTANTVSAKEFFTIKNGELERPSGYREWIYVGTPITPDDMNNGKANFPEFHSVYIDPESWDHWKKTGEFRDGTMLVKEMNKVGSKSASSGQGYFMGRFMGLEATIKSKREFPNEPGNWAYFSFSTADHNSLKKTAKAEPTANCNACHDNAAKDDFVFTQYYPVLEAGKADPKKAVGGEW
ncbi:MAG: cytochrome P460 family protein [Burkholderiales bacterium]|nr:cytochrome P460 family protein [Burkholderiales bacterium]